MRAVVDSVRYERVQTSVFISDRPFFWSHRRISNTYALFTVYLTTWSESSTALMRQHGGWKRVLRSVLGLLRVRVCCRMCSRTTDHTGKVLEQAIMFNYTLEHSFLLTWTKNVDDCFPLLSYITSGPPCFLKYAVFFFLLVCRECYLFRHCHQLNGNSSH